MTDQNYTLGTKGVTVVVGVTGIDEVSRKLSGLERKLRGQFMSDGMREALKVYRAGILTRIASMKKTGRLQRSIRRRVKKIGEFDIEGRVSIGNKVNGRWAFYAQWLEAGSGLYGKRHRAYRIEPKGRGKAIMWPGAPHPYRSALVKGVRARHFTEQTSRAETPKAVNAFAVSVDEDVMKYWESPTA